MCFQDELKKDRTTFSKQKHELLEQLKIQTETVRPTPLPDDLLNKIRELNSALLDNRKLMDIIQKINNEKKQVENELEQLRRHHPQQVNYNELSSWVSFLLSVLLKIDFKLFLYLFKN